MIPNDTGARRDEKTNAKSWKKYSQLDQGEGGEVLTSEVSSGMFRFVQTFEVTKNVDIYTFIL